jgi:hypothetical protein
MSAVPTNYPSEAALGFEGRTAIGGIAIGFSLANSVKSEALSADYQDKEDGDIAASFASEARPLELNSCTPVPH